MKWSEVKCSDYTLYVDCIVGFGATPKKKDTINKHHSLIFLCLFALLPQKRPFSQAFLYMAYFIIRFFRLCK